MRKLYCTEFPALSFHHSLLILINSKSCCSLHTASPRVTPMYREMRNDGSAWFCFQFFRRLLCFVRNLELMISRHLSMWLALAVIAISTWEKSLFYGGTGQSQVVRVSWNWVFACFFGGEARCLIFVNMFPCKSFSLELGSYHYAYSADSN